VIHQFWSVVDLVKAGDKCAEDAEQGIILRLHQGILDIYTYDRIRGTAFPNLIILENHTSHETRHATQGHSMA
jgi:hypothetical protein